MQDPSNNTEYLPSEDTMLIADHIQHERGGFALDVGSGSGYLTKLLEENFRLVVGTDINFKVLASQTYKTPNLICCNASDALRVKFELVVCNMPYLATDEILDAATDGGREGLEVPKRIMDSVIPRIQDGGRFVFVTSSLSNHGELMRYAQERGLETRVLAEKRLFFERLVLMQGTK